MPAERAPSWSRYLRRLPLFADLSREDMAALASIAIIQDVPAGRRVWRQGDPGDRLIVVLRGQLEATRVNVDGHLEPLARLVVGSASGETSLLLGDAHDATLTALVPSRLLVLHRNQFQALARSRPSLSAALRPREDICVALEAPRLRWQEPDERVTLYERRHPWVFWRSLFWPFLFGALTPPTIQFLGLSFEYLLSAALIAVAWVTWLWLEWRNDALVLTTSRIVRVEKQLLFYERQEQAALDKIQDVSVVRRGLAAAVLGFGHLTVQTAGATGQITFSYAPRPEAIKDAIFAETSRFNRLQRAWRRYNLEQELRRQLGLVPATDPDEPEAVSRPSLPQPQGALDAAALRLTHLINDGLPRLRRQEGDVVLWRKHWVVLLRSLAWPVVTAAALAGVPLLAGVSLPQPVSLGTAGLFLAWVWWQWENWRNDVYVLTPDRVIDIKRLPLRLHASQREGNLLNIQNVTYVVPGLLAGLLNYGHVTIETAGQVGNFTFESVFAPAEVQADVFRYLEASRERLQAGQQAAQSEALADILAAYERLRSDAGKAGSHPARADLP
ncbi:MAG: cyclic nucleotide-binding domain-containing protein [Anaerolineae bacterium]|nr:cyclic nucleotide-binding domain-containing protein [Anaerolineae bacterium]